MEKDALVAKVEAITLTTPGVDKVFAFAGAGGINANTGGAESPIDTIGQLQIELVKWEDRKNNAELDGNVVLANLEERLATIPGIHVQILDLGRGPASGKPVQLRLKAKEWNALLEATDIAIAKMAAMDGIIEIEDTRPLPGIDWQIDVDVEKAGRFGADVATVGGMVQLVTRGILLDTMRVDSSDEEIEIRVRLPEHDRVLSTLETLKVRTPGGLVPLSNFITMKPVHRLGKIDRVDGERYFDIKAGVTPGLENADGLPINGNERIAVLTDWNGQRPPVSTRCFV